MMSRKREPYRVERRRKLRDLGFGIWDPIGLLDAGETWEGQPFCDEYDHYLATISARLYRRQTEKKIAEWVVKVEAEDMSLVTDTNSLCRARKLVSAIKADPDLWQIQFI